MAGLDRAGQGLAGRDRAGQDRVVRNKDIIMRGGGGGGGRVQLPLESKIKPATYEEREGGGGGSAAARIGNQTRNL